MLTSICLRLPHMHRQLSLKTQRVTINLRETACHMYGTTPDRSRSSRWTGVSLDEICMCALRHACIIDAHGILWLMLRI